MPISCIPVSLYPDFRSGKLTNAEWIKLGAQAGLDGVDFSPSFLPEDPKALEEMRRQLEDAGLQGVMIVGHQDFTHPDPAKRRQEIQQAIKWVKMAKTLGCPYIRTTAGQAHPQLSRQQGIDLAVEGMNEVARVAVDLGVTLAYENHYKSAFWEYEDFSRPHDIYLAILEGCSAPGVGVNFDTANPVFNNEDPLELLEAVAPRIVSIHVNDLKAAGEFDPVLIGTGVVPLQAIFHRLRELGFDGWLCIEEFSRTGPGAVAKACQWLRKSWQAGN